MTVVGGDVLDGFVARSTATQTQLGEVLDTRLRTPLDANLVQRPDLSTWIVNGDHNRDKQNNAFRQKGITPINCRRDDDGLIDLLT
jgi:riboflavin biosynthesis pyrimidine reductase